MTYSGLSLYASVLNRYIAKPTSVNSFTTHDFCSACSQLVMGFLIIWEHFKVILSTDGERQAMVTIGEHQSNASSSFYEATRLRSTG